MLQNLDESIRSTFVRSLSWALYLQPGLNHELADARQLASVNAPCISHTTQARCCLPPGRAASALRRRCFRLRMHVCRVSTPQVACTDGRGQLPWCNCCQNASESCVTEGVELGLVEVVPVDVVLPRLLRHWWSVPPISLLPSFASAPAGHVTPPGIFLRGRKDLRPGQQRLLQGIWASCRRCWPC